LQAKKPVFCSVMAYSAGIFAWEMNAGVLRFVARETPQEKKSKVRDYQISDILRVIVARHLPASQPLPGCEAPSATDTAPMAGNTVANAADNVATAR